MLVTLKIAKLVILKTLIMLVILNIVIPVILNMLVVLIILNKFKSYYQSTINDQEDLQGRLDLIYKTTNVFVIIIVLTIIIGTLTSLNMKSLRKKSVSKVPTSILLKVIENS